MKIGRTGRGSPETELGVVGVERDGGGAARASSVAVFRWVSSEYKVKVLDTDRNRGLDAVLGDEERVLQ